MNPTKLLMVALFSELAVLVGAAAALLHHHGIFSSFRSSKQSQRHADAPSGSSPLAASVEVADRQPPVQPQRPPEVAGPVAGTLLSAPDDPVGCRFAPVPVNSLPPEALAVCLEPSDQAWLARKCICGAYALQGTVADRARVCLACSRVMFAKGHRVSVVPVASWSAFAEREGAQGFGGAV